MQRRNFLGGLAGILAVGAAPAIIHDAMKIVVPKRKVIEVFEWNSFHHPGIGLGNVDNRSNEQILMDGLAEARREAKDDILAGRRPYQMIDTSRGFRLYEIPVVPIGTGKYVPVRVPVEKRVLRFTL